MIAIATRLRPYQVTLVPEKREEVTTEGGLDIDRERARAERAIGRLRDSGIRVSLFIDPSTKAVQLSRELGADAVELHTGEYANRTSDPETLRALESAARFGADAGIAVHAGHGLTLANVGSFALIP
jgi:pyridoxine 5-phosphate synthase